MTVPPLALRAWCFLFVFTVSQLAVAASEPAFWRATTGKGTVYLLGSMHFGHEQFYPLPNLINEAYQQSDVLVVEVDVSRVGPGAAQRALAQFARLPLGQTLSMRLSSDVYSGLGDRLAVLGIPIATLEQSQPWFAAVQLIEAQIRQTPLSQRLGVDLHFLSRGQKPVEQLESLEQQLALFGGLSFREQERFLTQTLRDMDGSHKYLQSTAEAWQRGDVKALEAALIDPFENNAETKELFEKIFTERNDAMAAAVSHYLKYNRDVFFVVGVGHMLGEHGIIAQLLKRGVHVTRVDFSSPKQPL